MILVLFALGLFMVTYGTILYIQKKESESKSEVETEPVQYSTNEFLKFRREFLNGVITSDYLEVKSNGDIYKIQIVKNYPHVISKIIAGTIFTVPDKSKFTTKYRLTINNESYMNKFNECELKHIELMKEYWECLSN